MKTNWNAKSLIAGALLGAGIVTLIGAATAPELPDVTVGRFQVSSGDASGFILDTVTGQAWPVNVHNPGSFKPKLKLRE
jgi:hypothetical protein